MDGKLNICIPSYRRADKQKTIDYLLKIGCPKDWITVTVQDMQDYEDYRANGVHKRIGRLVFNSGKGVSDNRNNCLNCYQRGEKVIMLEDDISAISRLAIYPNGKRKLVPIKTIQQLISVCNRGFQLVKKHGTVLFGISMTRNAMFMSLGYSERKLVGGVFMGIINTEIRFDSDLQIFEDTDFCAQTIKRYGACISLNDIAAIFGRKTNAGGCREIWADKRNIDIGLGKIRRKHADLFKIDRTKENMIYLKKKGVIRR